MPPFSTGDLIAAVGVLVLFATFVIDKWRHAATKVAAESSHDSAITVRVEGLDQLMKAQMSALTALAHEFGAHKVEDAGFHGEMRTEVGAVKGELQGMNRRLDALTAQVSRLTPADTFAEIVPGRRARAER